MTRIKLDLESDENLTEVRILLSKNSISEIITDTSKNNSVEVIPTPLAPKSDDKVQVVSEKDTKFVHQGIDPDFLSIANS